MVINRRLQKLRQKLIDGELDSIIIYQPDNYRYISGFDGSAGTLLISQNNAILVTDFRYIEQAESQAPDFKVIRIKGESRERFLLELASELGIKSIGFEENNIYFSEYRRLSEEAEKLILKITPVKGLVESLRAVKDEEEVACIMKACELADASLEYIAEKIKPGMTEKEVAWKLEAFLREHGSESLPFNIIVASGPNAALPHAKPTDRSILRGEPITIDLGARISGYISDITRTLCIDAPDPTFSEIYELVLNAQQTAIDYLEAGMTGEQVDSSARKVIEQGGYKDAFGHGLGHGIGLVAHEQPRVSPNSKDVLSKNMVFTIEPGIYLSGWGGVRIEDVVMMQGDKAKTLSKARK